MQEFADLYSKYLAGNYGLKARLINIGPSLEKRIVAELPYKNTGAPVRSFMGIPVILDESMPEGEIRVLGPIKG